jgi:murein DD-endopeptidase MepM/ murein hydrolase activator NlpD
MLSGQRHWQTLKMVQHSSGGESAHPESHRLFPMSVFRFMSARWFRNLVRWSSLVAAALLVCFLVFTGPRDLHLYPPAAQSPYLLPWESGVTRWCAQGNRAVVSHRGREEFAYDFVMPVGTKVCAARGGVVSSVQQSHDGNGFRAPNNAVVIRHEDGTLGWYLHIKKDGALVRKGDRVAQGQTIALSGNVGHSTAPHLHFHVTDAKRNCLRVTFADVAGDGIPRMFRCYTARG